MNLLKTLRNLALLHILSVVYLLDTTSTVHGSPLIAETYNSQTLIVVNFRSPGQKNPSLNLEDSPNLKKYFLNEGVMVDIVSRPLANQAKTAPIWYPNQLNNQQKSGVIQNLINLKENFKNSVILSADLDNLLDWRERINTLVNWLTDKNDSKRINFGVLNFSLRDKTNKFGKSNNYDLIASYLVRLLINAGRLNWTNIILDIDSPSGSLILARGPVFKQNVVAEKVSGIDMADIYSLMCFILGLEYDNKASEKIRIIINDKFFNQRSAVREKNNFLHYIKHILPRYQRFQLNLTPRNGEANESYLRNLYDRIGLKERLKAVKNEFYVLMLLIILMFVLIVVQLNNYRYSND